MTWILLILLVIGILYFLNWYGSQNLPDKYSKNNGYPEIPAPNSSEEIELSFGLENIDGRRLRGQDEDVFPIKLWYGESENRIYVYPAYDDSESTKGIGVVPSRYTKKLYPFIYGRPRHYRYKGYFDKTSNNIELKLSQSSNDDYELYKKKRKEDEKDRIEHAQTKWVEKLQKGYKPQKDFEQSITIGTNSQFKGKRKLKNPSFVFLDKKHYENVSCVGVKLLEDGKELLTFDADERLIRAYYSDYDCIIKDSRFDRSRYSDYTHTILRLTVAYHKEVN